MKKHFAAGFAACYLMGATFFAGSIYRAMPCAMSVPGAVYYGALWPLAPLSVWMNRDLYPIPAWSFNFKRCEPRHD